MVEAFCFICLKFERKEYCLGFCPIKMHKINQPFRRCTEFKPFSHSDNDHVERWFMRAAEYARLRYECVKRYFEEIKEK